MVGVCWLHSRDMGRDKENIKFCARRRGTGGMAPETPQTYGLHPHILPTVSSPDPGYVGSCDCSPEQEAEQEVLSS